MTTWLEEEMEKQGLLLYALPDREGILKGKLRKFAGEILKQCVPTESAIFGGTTNALIQSIWENAQEKGIEL